MKKVANQNALNEAEMNELKALPSLSAQVRYLAAKEMARADIQRYISWFLGKEVVYQHVKGILDRPLKKG